MNFLPLIRLWTKDGPAATFHVFQMPNLLATKMKVSSRSADNYSSASAWNAQSINSLLNLQSFRFSLTKVVKSPQDLNPCLSKHQAKFLRSSASTFPRSRRKVQMKWLLSVNASASFQTFCLNANRPTFQIETIWCSQLRTTVHRTMTTSSSIILWCSTSSLLLSSFQRMILMQGF